MSFSKTDVQVIQHKGQTVEKVEQQLQTFKAGLPVTTLKAAATIGKGIVSVPESDKHMFIRFFNDVRDAYTIQKFVPASGAATRMFKFLYHFLETFNPEQDDFKTYTQNHPDLLVFANGLERFPFYEKVVKHIPDFKALDLGHKTHRFASVLLNSNGLNYGALPKGLLPFHKYTNQTRTAFAEHLLEAARYAVSKGKANVHFTISPQHENNFKDQLQEALKMVGHKTGVQVDVAFSFQKETTDTVAVNLDNTPFRLANGAMLFRPGGHGALIENLNDLNADIVFVKNIDNVVIDAFEEDVVAYKKMLAGMLLKLQQESFAYAKVLEEGKVEDLGALETFLTESLNVIFLEDYNSLSTPEKIGRLKTHLNKPIRVCGMVKNEGEPGGGPFWTENSEGRISLQIVESAQMNTADSSQRQILQNATHFNPVDLVCGLKNYKGEAFNLTQFVDAKAAFITQKDKAGKPLKALELPGLWNGAMAHWNTIFVEVPLLTFNPVKTVNDLLKPTHQPHV
ncbi:MAG: DUF4301 family protein [Algicola sp.]|nr:DUF4301 family protein [Algicola sp.]